MIEDILSETHGRLGLVALNRPKDASPRRRPVTLTGADEDEAQVADAFALPPQEEELALGRP